MQRNEARSGRYWVQVLVFFGSLMFGVWMLEMGMATAKAQRQSPAPGRGGKGKTAGQSIKLSTTRNLPAVTAAQAADCQQSRNLHPPLPPVVEVKKQAPVATPITDAPQSSALLAAPQAPGDVSVPVRRDFSSSEIPLNRRSLYHEPKVANRGQTVFYVADWYAALSTNGGQTFSYIDPATAFPPASGGFCCGQDVAYSAKYDLTAWVIPYSPNAAGNTLRIARAVGDELAANSWRYYDFTTQNFGLPDGHRLSYVRATLSENWLYISANAFRQSDGAFVHAVMMRISLQSLADAGGALWYWYRPPAGFGDLRCTEGAQGDMYFAAFVNNATLRIYRWPDDLDFSSITANDVALNHPFTFVGGDAVAICPDGTNWASNTPYSVLAGWVSRGTIGFAWSAKQDTARNRPYPYTIVARFNESDRSLIEVTDIWNDTFAWLYPSVAVNRSGNVGVILGLGGGVNYPTTSVFLIDDLNPTLPPATAFTVASSNAGPANNTGWGYWMGVQPHLTEPNTFVAATYYLQGGGNSSNVVPRYVRFGRERDFLSCGLTAVTIGQTVNGGLSASDCLAVGRGGLGGTAPYADRYSLSGSAGQRIVITMSASFDTYLNLIGPDGRVIYGDDDGGGGTNSRIPTGGGSFTLPVSGNYVIEATSFSDGAVGAYTLSLTTDCSYSIAPASATFSAAGGTGSVTVTAGGGCAWTAVSQVNWITITAGGNGNGTVNYSVAANSGTGRTGTMTIAGQTFTVTQGCLGTVITAQPITQTLCPGSQASFSVAATGAGTLSFQWRKNGVNLPGATGSSYSILAVTAGDAGSYSVVVTGACDSATSNAATLTVNASPSVTTHPANQSVAPGTTATFTAAASGIPAPTLQWQISTDGVNFNNVSGATSTSVTVSNVTLAQNGNRYRAVFSNACGTATSNVATLNVGCPAINLSPTTLPDGATGTSYNQTLTASGGTAPYSFRVSVGGLPTGLGLSSAGALSGTPTQGGTFNFTITATDANNCTGSRAYTLIVTCAFDISPKSQSFGANGGGGSVSVLTGNGCGWTAASNVAWITITGGASGTGNGSVNYSVAANPGTSQRQGTMTIAGLTFTVTQAGTTPNPTPTLSSLNPSSVVAGGAAFTLTVNGSNFVTGALVRWNGSDRQTNFVSASQLMAQIPAADIAAAGSVQITVFNPAPGGGNSTAMALTITPVTSGFTISGRITYSDAGRVAVPGTVVTATSLDTTLSSQPSGGDGRYAITGVVRGTYGLKAEKSGSINGGITAFDAARILQRLISGEPFLPLQLKAADVNGDGVADVKDATLIASFIVGKSGAGQAGVWYLEAVNGSTVGVSGNLPDQNFKAALIGDVTGNWAPGNSLSLTAVTPVTLSLKNNATGDAVSLPGVSISGAGFSPGVALIVIFPDGGEMKLSGAQIVARSPESITVALPVIERGLWAFRVVNADGKMSEAFVVKIE